MRRRAATQVTIRGRPEAQNRARLALDILYGRLKKGHDLAPGDIDGAIRMAEAADAQMSLPSLESGGRARNGANFDAAAHGHGTDARPGRLYSRHGSGRACLWKPARPGPERPILPSAFAAAMLERGTVDRLILSRPAVEAGERLGFLPGDMREKVDPYLRPLYDALYDMMPAEKVERGLQTGVIEVAPLAFMRGRTLANAAIILG